MKPGKSAKKQTNQTSGNDYTSTPSVWSMIKNEQEKGNRIDALAFELLVPKSMNLL